MVCSRSARWSRIPESRSESQPLVIAINRAASVSAFPGSKLIPPILGTVVFVYGGLVFIRGAWRERADRKPAMMALISLAIIVAFGTSLAATFGLFEIEVWWELATLITIMILGHWLEVTAISQARGALNALAALLPDTAESVRKPSSCRYDT